MTGATGLYTDAIIYTRNPATNDIRTKILPMEELLRDLKGVDDEHLLEKLWDKLQQVYGQEHGTVCLAEIPAWAFDGTEAR